MRLARLTSRGFARTRITAVLEAVVDEGGPVSTGRYLIQEVDLLLRASTGIEIPAMRTGGSVVTALDACPDDGFLDVVEALVEVATRFHRLAVPSNEVPPALKRILREARIAIDFTGGQFVRFSSQELHAEMVVPAITLLASKPGWENVEVSYQKALAEPDPADAITDVGTALQEAFTVLGFRGNKLGALIKDARKHGWILGHDVDLLDAIADFVSADRSEMGNAHRASTPYGRRCLARHPRRRRFHSPTRRRTADALGRATHHRLVQHHLRSRRCDHRSFTPSCCRAAWSCSARVAVTTTRQWGKQRRRRRSRLGRRAGSSDRTRPARTGSCSARTWTSRPRLDSCDDAHEAGRQIASSYLPRATDEGLETVFSLICFTMQAEGGQQSRAPKDYREMAIELDARGVCPGDPGMLIPE